jgi:hypothetical protein
MNEPSDTAPHVSLEAALDAIAEEVRAASARADLEAETFRVDLQVGLVLRGGRLSPVVYIERAPPGAPVHGVTLTACCGGRERGRRGLEARADDEIADARRAPPAGRSRAVAVRAIGESGEGRTRETPSTAPDGWMQPDGDTGTADDAALIAALVDLPPRAERDAEHGSTRGAMAATSTPGGRREADAPRERARAATPVGADEDPRDERRRGPKIVLPKNPLLKLRHASDAGGAAPHPADDAPVKRTEVTLDDEADRGGGGGRDSRRRVEVKDQRPQAERRGVGSPLARYIIFDHQRFQGVKLDRGKRGE